MKSERRLKNKTILAIILVLLALCTIYFSIGVKNQKKYIDWQIQKDSEIVNIEIKNLLYNTSRLYKDKIQYFINNNNIKKEFNVNNLESLYKKVFPYFSVLKSEYPYYFEVNFYLPDNSLFLNMEKGLEGSLEIANSNSLVSKVNELKQKERGFEMVNSFLHYKIVEPIFYNKEYVGCVEFGIRENEVIENIAMEFGISAAGVFDGNKLQGIQPEDIKPSIAVDSFLVHSIFEKETFEELLEANQGLSPGKFQSNQKYYSLSFMEVENNFRELGFIGVVYIKDISLLQNQFHAALYRSLLIILLILTITFVILHYSFNTLLHKVFNLQDSIDKRLLEKSNEIIKTNAELNQIFNTTGSSMRLISNNFDVLRINRSFSMLSGISKEDAEGKKCYDVFPGVHCHTDQCPLNLIKNGEEKIEQYVKKKDKHGKIISGILSSVPFTGQNGEMLGIIEDFKDVTKRIEIEDALKRTEQQFSTFMDNLPLGVFIKDEESKAVYINKYMDQAYAIENYKDKTPHEIFPEEYANRVVEEDKKVLDGEVLVLENQLPDKSGNIQTYQTHKFRFKGVDKSWQIGGLSINITESIKTQEQLKILQNAIQHSPACVIILNFKKEIQYVNPRFTEITGYTPEEVRNKEISILNPDDNSVNIYQNIPKVVLTGKEWQGEFQHIKKNGEKHWELASISPVKNENGRITHFVVISEDITSRKKTENELIYAKEKAEESNKLKTAFLANLSHEIRTPMNAIVGFSNLLLDKDISYEEKLKLKNLIDSNSQNLLKLIDDVIDISKMQSGDIEINKTPVYLNKLLLDLYVSASIKIENDDKKNIHLSMNKGSRNKDFSILADSVRLKQILYNLIENAIKFTKKGFVEFGYTLMQDENKIQFYVIDSGIGISNEKFDMIYDLFRQADDSLTREYGGTGLGLTIAKKMIDLLGGKIWVQSTPNQGTNIYFTLPLELADSNQVQTNNKEEKFDWENKVVLVADDIVINYKLFEEILIPTKAKVLWAKNGKEAVELCTKDKVDLVLMDIKMPEMDGFEATKEIKKLKSDVKIIGQTAYAHINSKQKCLNAGFDSYISKPIIVDTFLSTINQVFLKN